MTTTLVLNAILAWMWQVILHSFVCSVVFYGWTRWLGLPSGRTRRHLLAAALVLPMLTALVPGRSGIEFRGSMAWFDGGRVLSLPLYAGVHLNHVVVAIGLLSVVATVWQEFLPALRHTRLETEDAPAELVRRARVLPGWSACRVVVTPSDEILIATDGPPWSPRAIFSRGSLEHLQSDQIDAVLRHENAHRRNGRWWVVHLLFALRTIQIFNPFALWCFREYCVEVEILCDADAVAGYDNRSLATALLAVYETADPRDGSLGALRKRVDLLLGRRPYDTLILNPAVELLAISLLSVTLPWLV